jgi:hypothetical protein
VNCNQELCIELSSAINFHREIEPANLLQYVFLRDFFLYNRSGKLCNFSARIALNFQVFKPGRKGVNPIYLNVYLLRSKNI